MLPPPAAGEGPAATRLRVREAARELETSFVVELLKTAREAGEALGGESRTVGAESYQEFAERALAQELARRGIFGFARLVERQLLSPEAGLADKPVGRAEP